MSPTQHETVVLSPAGLVIQGEPVLLLASSLFYFRIPRGLWGDRLWKVKRAGYNAIDVYFPWNYHELAEDMWDFSAERDVAAFLRLAAETGLWVVARPGPYVCSEWDGGGLPAYLFTDPDLRVRDNESRYLQHVTRWYDKILPILSSFQLDRAGSIIAVQLENELDFFECADRSGYMTALRDLALKHDISVPLIACAGQGDLAGATGDVPGIVPTVNLYDGERKPGVEARASYYQELLAARGLPLCVTETHRSHFFLRRLLSCGVKWFGPYNQTSGTDFGFTNAVNNWGDPLSLLTSDYDFCGMISASGELRAEYLEASLLARLVTSLHGALALATPIRNHGIIVEGGLHLPDGGPYVLALNGGGLLIALPNTADQARRAELRDAIGSFPCHVSLAVPPGQCPLLLRNVPLANWGLQGTLMYATAELGSVETHADQVVMVFHSDSAAELAFSFPPGATVSTDEMAVHADGAWQTFCFDGRQPVSATIRFADGRVLRVVGLSREDDCQVEFRRASTISTGSQANAGRAPRIGCAEERCLAVAWRSGTFRDPVGRKVYCGPRPMHLEEAGILRGFGWYRARIQMDWPGRIAGFLLQDAADILSLYVDGVFHGTAVPGGGVRTCRPHPCLTTPQGI